MGQFSRFSWISCTSHRKSTDWRFARTLHHRNTHLFYGILGIYTSIRELWKWWCNHGALHTNTATVSYFSSSMRRGNKLWLVWPPARNMDYQAFSYIRRNALLNGVSHVRVRVFAVYGLRLQSLFCLVCFLWATEDNQQNAAGSTEGNKRTIVYANTVIDTSFPNIHSAQHV